MKRCISCGQTKDVPSFGRNRATPDGLSVYCLECNRIKSRAYYRARREAAGHVFREPDPSPPGFKRCSQCRRVLPLTAYHVHKTQSDGLNTYCKDCRRVQNRDVHLWRTYGLSSTDFDDMLQAQGGLCAICRENPAEHVDHCHETGAVRGILCFNCNGGLGQFRDRVDILLMAVAYLERTRNPQWLSSDSTGASPLPTQRQEAAPSPTFSEQLRLIF